MGPLGTDLLSGGASFYTDLPEVVMALIGVGVLIAFIAAMGLLGRWPGWDRQYRRHVEKRRGSHQAITLRSPAP